jgi:DNA-binding MarR family transcriptional regulator
MRRCAQAARLQYAGAMSNAQSKPFSARRGNRTSAVAAQVAQAQPADLARIPQPVCSGGLDGLYLSPEFLIRRAHQIASATFAQACADLDLTPSQYAVLFALRQHQRVGQNALGRLVSLDRSTTSLVVRSLRDRGFVSGDSDPSDRRKTFLTLSDTGRLVLAQAEQRSARSSQALMAVFDAKQAREFLTMLRKISEPLGADPA